MEVMIERWKRLMKRINGLNITPDGFEIYNGSVIFWFSDPTHLKEVLLSMKKAGIDFTIEWDKEEGLTGVVLRKELLKQ